MATAGISFIREHTEQIKPPRALWVPFELGRPLGAPNEPEFQLDVLRALLRTLEEDRGPVLIDYPHDAPALSGDHEPWACLIPAPPLEPARSEAEALNQRLSREISLLRPWYDESVKAHGRTAVRTSGLALAEMTSVLAAYAAGETPQVPSTAVASMPYLLRFLADDLKAYYLEAAVAQPGGSSPSSTELGRWLFHETALGDVLFRVLGRLASSEDQRENRLSGTTGVIVPRAYMKRPANADRAG